MARYLTPGRVAALAVGVVLLAYLCSIDAPFFLVDDPFYVTANSVLQNVPLSEPWRFFTTRTNPWEYLPLRDFSYRLDLALFGLNPTGFRAHNLLLYALSCWAAWRAALEMVRVARPQEDPARARWLAAVATILFATHPAHAESVCWIAGRKDVLSGLLALLSLWLFASSLGRTAGRGRRLAGSCLCFAAAILSKSTVVTVPLAAGLLALLHHAQPRLTWTSLRRAALPVLPLLALSAVSVALQLKGSIAYCAGPIGVSQLDAPADRALLSLKILGTLARVGLLPVNLRLIYDVEQGGAAGQLIAAFGALALIGAALGATLAVTRRSLAGIGAGIAGILALPFLQLIPFTTWSFVSERFLFLPVLGLGLALASVLVRGRPGWAVAALLFALGLAGTAVRARQWQSGPGLLADAALKAPGHPIAVGQYLHQVLMPAGQLGAARAAVEGVHYPRYREFLDAYLHAEEESRAGHLDAVRALLPGLLRVASPDDFAARAALANLAASAGLHAEAEAAYRALLRDFPGVAEMHYNLGLELNRQRRFAEAAAEMRTATEGGFSSATVWNNLGLACRDAGQPEQAVTALRAALKADPAHWHAGFNLARLLWSRGDRPGARAALSEARRRAVAAGAQTAPLDQLQREFGP